MERIEEWLDNLNPAGRLVLTVVIAAITSVIVVGVCRAFLP